MRTIAHISDLHFGRLEAAAAEGLVEDLARRRPDILVISGDFTQRARPSQYEQAAAYLKRLPTPQIVVPGNHDVPLWNVGRRFFFPLHRYRRHISDNLMPVYQDSEVFIIGVNSARSFTRTSGWLDRRQLRQIRDAVAAAPTRAFKVLVTHHPFIPAPQKPDADVLRRAAGALQQLESCGFDLLLAGHLHLAYHQDVRSHHVALKRSVISIQAGTATSTRRRVEPNAYNWITLAADRVNVEVRSWSGAAFEATRVSRFDRSDGQWRQVDDSPATDGTDLL